MKHWIIAASAGLLLAGLGAGAASAEPHHRRHHHHWHGEHRHHRPPGVWIDRGFVRIVPPRRHHRRECWYENRVGRDRFGYRELYTVRVCR
ncbi:hypothetical protein [Rhizobium sp. C4]|uniref:hypothetical protein n=1 Tax=Rhizobium sp. C4 TaxID=1349800 RepID=UPI001E5B7680|nr:hypothetical protein [Rhizobium sp. C4]MCD2174492.1 hypothetical protein [Rhizobium sp. C4]